MGGGKGFAAHDDGAQEGEHAGAAGGQLMEERGGEEGDGGTVAFHVPGQVLERRPFHGAHDHGGAGGGAPHTSNVDASNVIGEWKRTRSRGVMVT